MPADSEPTNFESSTPKLRIRAANDKPINHDGDFVLYWMIAYRRTEWNFALERAAAWAAELGKPLVVLEALRCDYKWASDRLHAFVIQGMADNQQSLAKKSRAASYYPYLERQPGNGSGLLEALSDQACLVVTDDFPCFFLPRMVRVAARKVSTTMEVIDSNGLLPMRAADKVYLRAYDLRRFLQKALPDHLSELPSPDPLADYKIPTLEKLPAKITKQWPVAEVEAIADDLSKLEAFPIDHQVGVVESLPGGAVAAQKRLRDFLKHKLDRYGEERNEPQKEVSSGFSPYLHFGHLSVHQVFAELVEQLKWTPNKLAKKANGSRSGWWGMEETYESFLDELVTWRELGFNMCSRQEDYTHYESLPDWAKETLGEHASDDREFTYTLEEFEQANTHDELWNAAQNQLVREGYIHNYLRMLWGKKILEWTESPQDALAVMIELNNKYALDGRNPNSYSGIFWVLGRYDRAWGPERPIFGKIRYMSSDNTARKVKVKQYIEKYQ
ncbi:deoxyribodipyrimidine photolyase [Aeoliella mucimassa]|uniref:Deoxyribodipyrimidine photo-lyase n=1 Tax=Aeoliella mucimassa TaxID=2527972 RepID=A0A518AJT4_9BACT|nr:deoxyribodipyrimidine photolyase [Aeoliella mucimassa]QDU54934.1 Deoxyribodipyrimidine photo-lyase [Aeoliella mucimassa]